MRKIDRILIHGQMLPIEIYTFDLNMQQFSAKISYIPKKEKKSDRKIRIYKERITRDNRY